MKGITIKIKSILIANRGEIAVRIIRACHELGIKAIAIFTEVDRYSLHVKRADEAYCLGNQAVAGYLNADKIIQIAKKTQADAIHPGFGFLSENADFASACTSAGLTFIGPSADVIATMGDKQQARCAMVAAGIPVVPGSAGNVTSVEDAITQATQIGFPVMLKATGGGGGRGIRLCEDAKALKNHYPRVINEAQKYFNSTDVYLEKAIVAPKHIEVQVLADSQGQVVHLYERDCSIQRRHQKLIEIAPSPQISETLRDKLCQWAVEACKAVGYENAGTVEFMVDDKSQAYFLEMNTRLQVEHPITEQITGIDIVKTQISIASGEALAFKQGEISIRGFAMEFRINAEDPKNDFLPSFGKITQYYAPGGPGVRVDSAIYTGYQIPTDFDSMCVKLTVWALTWPELLARGHRALLDMRVRGIKTTLAYYQQVINQADFKNRQFSTNFVESHPELLDYPEGLANKHAALVMATALLAGLEE